MGLLHTMVELASSIPNAPGPPMSPVLSATGGAPSIAACGAMEPPPQMSMMPDLPPPPDVPQPPPDDVPFFGAKGKDYVTVGALKRIGAWHRRERSVKSAAVLLVTLPVAAYLVLAEDTIRNPVWGVTIDEPKVGCPHG